jgi:hypothetical protein
LQPGKRRAGQEKAVRKIIVTLMCILVLAAGAVFGATPVAPGSQTQTTVASADRVYRALTNLPLADRKAVFRGLLPAMKAEVWRAHFRTFTAENTISPQQAAIIEAAHDLFTEDLFAISKSDPAWESQVHVPLQRLEQSARTLFPPQLLLAAFGQLGPGDVGETAAVSAPDMRALRSGLVPAPLLVSECTCSVASDWCFSGSCGGAICWKAESDTGCGFGWRYECDSKCNRN